MPNFYNLFLAVWYEASYKPYMPSRESYARNFAPYRRPA